MHQLLHRRWCWGQQPQVLHSQRALAQYPLLHIKFYRSDDLLRKGEAAAAARKCEAGLEGRHHHRPLGQREIYNAKFRQAARVRIAAASSGQANVNIRGIFEEDKLELSSLGNVDMAAPFNGP